MYCIISGYDEYTADVETSLFAARVIGHIIGPEDIPPLTEETVAEEIKKNAENYVYEGEKIEEAVMYVTYFQMTLIGYTFQFLCRCLSDGNIEAEYAGYDCEEAVERSVNKEKQINVKIMNYDDYYLTECREKKVLDIHVLSEDKLLECIMCKLESWIRGGQRRMDGKEEFFSSSSTQAFWYTCFQNEDCYEVKLISVDAEEDYTRIAGYDEMVSDWESHGLPGEKMLVIDDLFEEFIDDSMKNNYSVGESVCVNLLDNIFAYTKDVFLDVRLYFDVSREDNAWLFTYSRMEVNV